MLSVVENEIDVDLQGVALSFVPLNAPHCSDVSRFLAG